MKDIPVLHRHNFTIMDVTQLRYKLPFNEKLYDYIIFLNSQILKENIDYKIVANMLTLNKKYLPMCPKKYEERQRICSECGQEVDGETEEVEIAGEHLWVEFIKKEN